MLAAPADPTPASYRFIAGDPMNVATNTFVGRSYRSRGVPYCCSSPPRSTATRSPIVIASVWSWVTYSVAAPSDRCTRSTSERICTRSFASRLDSGSSIRNTAGSLTIARAIATRCR